MKKRNALYLALVICISIGFVSCNDDDNKTEEVKGVALQTIQATTPVMYLTERTGWNLKIGYMDNSSIEYDFILKDYTLTATAPKGDPYYFDNTLKEGDKIHPANRVSIRFVSPDYYYTKTKETGPVPPRIQDQSTQEKFTNADLLACEYQDIVSKDIKDVVLTHDNAVVDFIVEGLPVGAKVVVYQPFVREITPLTLVNSIGRLHYQAIILSGYATAVGIIVGEDYYTAYLTDTDIKAVRNTRYTFNVSFDDETKVVAIKDLTSDEWGQ